MDPLHPNKTYQHTYDGSNETPQVVKVVFGETNFPITYGTLVLVRPLYEQRCRWIPGGMLLPYPSEPIPEPTK